MIRQREEGTCYAYSRADGSAYAFARECYDQLRSDWMAGKAFFTGHSVWGSSLTVKLGDIVAVSDVSAEQMALSRLDRQQDEREDAIDS